MAEKSLTDNLQDLHNLYKSGALTEEEYNSLKTKLISNENHENPIIRDMTFESNEKTKSHGIKMDKEKKSRIFKSIAISTLIIILVIVGIYFGSRGFEWDDDKAERIMMGKIHASPEWSTIEKESLSSSKSYQPFHRSVDFSEISFDNRHIVVGIVSSDDWNSNHYYSVFEFEKRRGYKLKKYSICFGVFDEHYRTAKISSDNYGVVAKRYESGYNIIEVFTFINDNFKEVFETWDDFEFIPTEEGYYDIKEIFNHRLVTNKFNGSEYVPQ